MNTQLRLSVYPFAAIVLLALLLLAGGCSPAADDTTEAEAEAASAAANGVSRQPPPPLPERPLEFPEFHTTELDNGLRLIVVEHAGQPVANVELYLGAGAVAEPAVQAGLAAMAAELVTKGTATRSAVDISAAIEGVGGRLASGADEDWLTVSATVLSEHLPLAFELVSDVALRPTFPEQEVAMTRRRTLSGLQAELGQPGAIARRQFVRELYGPDHPYGVSPIPGSIEAIARDDLVAFHAANFTAGNALLVVSGVVDTDEVVSLARTHFGAWQEGAPERDDLATPVLPEQTRISLVHRPGSVQSTIRIGHVAIRPDNPDFFALTVLNGIVGGGVDARLFQILREQHGWTYGAYSRLVQPADTGHFLASTEVRTEVTGDALAEMLRQLHRIRDERTEEEEFDAAKSFLAGSFPLRIETAGQIADEIARAELIGLPIEYVKEFRERIMAVTADDVQRVAQRYIQPERATIVVVGDAHEVLPMIESIAPVDVYDIEGEALQLEPDEAEG